MIPPPPEDATPDELEAYALRVWVAESQTGKGADRIAAAQAIVRLATDRRSRRAPDEGAPDPLEAAAAIQAAIEAATANIEKIDEGPSISVDNVPGVH